MGGRDGPSERSWADDRYKLIVTRSAQDFAWNWYDGRAGAPPGSTVYPRGAITKYHLAMAIDRSHLNGDAGCWNRVLPERYLSVVFSAPARSHPSKRSSRNPRSSHIYLPPYVTLAFLTSVHQKAVWCRVGDATEYGIGEVFREVKLPTVHTITVPRMQSYEIPSKCSRSCGRLSMAESSALSLAHTNGGYDQAQSGKRGKGKSPNPIVPPPGL